MSMDNFVQSASFPILLPNSESLNLAEFCSTSTLLFNFNFLTQAIFELSDVPEEQLLR